MTIGPNPFERLGELLERLHRQLGEARRAWNGERFGLGGRRSSMGIDLAERDDEFILTADLPGFAAEDVDVALVDGALRIAAEHEAAGADREETARRSERRRRPIRRTISLPEPVEADEATARYRNGVLTVTVPKRERPEARRIDIDVE